MFEWMRQGRSGLTAAVVLLTLFIGLSGCAEEKKKAEERGKIPKQTVDNAQKQVDAATAALNQNLGQADQAGED